MIRTPRVQLKALYCLIAIAACVPLAALSKQVIESKIPGKASKAVTLRGGIDQVDYALKSSGVTLDDAKLPAFVGNVRLGSPAYYGGLSEGDKVLSAHITENKLNLLFERKGKRFALSLRTSAADLSKLTKGVPLSDKIADVPLVPGVPLTDEQKLKELSKHDLIVLIDTSGSMAEVIPSLKMSKWQWCARFLGKFSERTKGALAGRGLTIIPFSTNYKILNGCTTDQISNLFASTGPDGGTDFASPLQEVLSNYFASGRQRPQMIAVFTDGIPSHGPRIEQVLINATKEMRSAREVQVTFLEVGEVNQGTNLLKYLDEFLVHDGAQYDVVQTVGFDQLKQMSLFDVFMLVLENKAVSTGGLDSEIDALKQQIESQRREAMEKATQKQGRKY
ncbi:hypothetical protein BH11CYA1_BH11CYA1_12440 [soil metagenome]